MFRIDFKKSQSDLKHELKKVHAYDLAQIYPQLDSDEQSLLLSLIDYKKIITIFEEVDQLLKVTIFSNAPTTERKKRLLDNLKMDELKEFIAGLETDTQSEVILLLKPNKQVVIREMLLYSSNLAASIMTTEFVSIKHTMTVKEATNYIVQNVRDDDFIDYLYVVDDDDKLIGVITLKNLILARSNDNLLDLLVDNYHFITEDKPIFEAIDIAKNYDIKAVPVLDQKSHIIGICLADDILDEVYIQQKESYQKLASIKDYQQKSTAFTRTIKRLPWLLIAILLEMIIANTTLVFEATIQKITALFLFQSMILATAGNIGTQSLAVTILSLHKKELKNNKDFRKHIAKEVKISIVNSLLLAGYGFIISFAFLSIPQFLNRRMPNYEVFSGSTFGYMLFPLFIASIVSLSLILAMIVSAFFGTSIPILIYKTKRDPANLSGPILTTINDMIAMLGYYGIATIFMKIIGL